MTAVPDEPQHAAGRTARGGDRDGHHAVLALFAAAILLGAALLFMVQPLLGRLLLPLFGGGPSVWNTSMVFFQAALLAGYLLAHLVATRIAPRRQVLAYGVVLAAAGASLPVALPDWSDPAGREPASWLLVVLAATAAVPFVAVSMAGPLLQHWFAGAGHRFSRDPYFLYAAGNVGSLGGLLAYPVLVEPAAGLQRQGVAWSIAFAAFALLAVTAGVVAARRRDILGDAGERDRDGDRALHRERARAAELPLLVADDAADEAAPRGHGPARVRLDRGDRLRVVLLATIPP